MSDQKIQKPPGEVSRIGDALLIASMGKKLSALRNDAPQFSDRPELQLVCEAAWRRAIDSAGAVLIDLQREMEGAA